jgi:hypothetical protein
MHAGGLQHGLLLLSFHTLGMPEQTERYTDNSDCFEVNYFLFSSCSCLNASKDNFIKTGFNI